MTRSGRSTRRGYWWPLVAAAGLAFLLVPGTALPLPTGNLVRNAGAEAGPGPTTSAGKPTRPRFGTVTFKRTATLTETYQEAQLTLSVKARIAPNAVATVDAALQFQGSLTCASPGPCSACPGVVLTETAVGSARSRRKSSPPFRTTPLSKTTYDLRLVADVKVEHETTEFTGEGCSMRTTRVAEVWKSQIPSAREIGGKAIKKLSGSVSRSFNAPPGGHVCGLAPHSGWAFSTCTETLTWKLSRLRS